MWKDFHKLPVRNDNYSATASSTTNAPSDDITAMLMLSAFLNGEMKELLEVLGPFLPGQGKATIDAAIQAREAAKQLNAQSRIKNAFVQQQEADLGSVVSAISNTSLVDRDTAAGMRHMATQFSDMQKEMGRMQSMMDKVQSGDTSSLMFELLGKSMPGMGDMGNMMNMMNMMNNMGQQSRQQ